MLLRLPDLGPLLRGVSARHGRLHVARAQVVLAIGEVAGGPVGDGQSQGVGLEREERESGISRKSELDGEVTERKLRKMHSEK